MDIDTPANQLVAGGFGQDSGGGHPSIAELQVLHCVGALLEHHIHPTGHDGDVVLPARRLLEGREVLALCPAHKGNTKGKSLRTRVSLQEIGRGGGKDICVSLHV